MNYIDHRVLLTLAMLLRNGRDQKLNPIVQREITKIALVSPRTTQLSLNRLSRHGMVLVFSLPGKPSIYVISGEGMGYVETHCWACGADREPGDRGDCMHCGASPRKLIYEL